MSASPSFFTIYYSLSHSGITWSREFMCEYEKRTGTQLENYEKMYVRDRTDVTQRQLVAEMGLGAFTEEDDVGVEHIPNLFRNYVEIFEYDGRERVRVNVHRIKGEALDRFMSSGSTDIAALEATYKEIVKSANEYNKLNGRLSRV